MREGDDVSELDDVQTTIGAIDGRRRLLLRLVAVSHGAALRTSPSASSSSSASVSL